MTKKSHDMELRMLKLATRKLLERFGSLEKAALSQRVSATCLSHYQNFDNTSYMPIDVVLALEKVVGEPIVSRELIDQHRLDAQVRPEGDVLDEALDIPVAVGKLLAYVREATAQESALGRRLSETEKRRYFELRRLVGEELRQLDLAVEQGGAFPSQDEGISQGLHIS